MDKAVEAETNPKVPMDATPEPHQGSPTSQPQPPVAFTVTPTRSPAKLKEAVLAKPAAPANEQPTPDSPVLAVSAASQKMTPAEEPAAPESVLDAPWPNATTSAAPLAATQQPLPMTTPRATQPAAPAPSSPMPTMAPSPASSAAPSKATSPAKAQIASSRELQNARRLAEAAKARLARLEGAGWKRLKEEFIKSGDDMMDMSRKREGAGDLKSALYYAQQAADSYKKSEAGLKSMGK